MGMSKFTLCRILSGGHIFSAGSTPMDSKHAQGNGKTAKI